MKPSLPVRLPTSGRTSSGGVATSGWRSAPAVPGVTHGLSLAVESGLRAARCISADMRTPFSPRPRISFSHTSDLTERPQAPQGALRGRSEYASGAVLFRRGDSLPADHAACAIAEETDASLLLGVHEPADGAVQP